MKPADKKKSRKFKRNTPDLSRIRDRRKSKA
jgi:hypothetical protein